MCVGWGEGGGEGLCVCVCVCVWGGNMGVSVFFFFFFWGGGGGAETWKQVKWMILRLKITVFYIHKQLMSSFVLVVSDSLC